ncbi:hypothetical protein D187_001697 [Cystobacter fuscus DSM 2262]|uniref:Uncharacterized protein n=1 Tax=Cystobacter fuscus (strain ATCC 25194 / DSM 2262 / NBRC 100088 / M29) TaxID=1242864 RepID=S9P9G6_CYSF2|nr:hypothetical protein D187_001697 [Cystobacter fuscus DSM 2262]
MVNALLPPGLSGCPALNEIDPWEGRSEPGHLVGATGRA